MGSKTKVYSNLQANRMLDEEHGLYSKELVRIYGQTLRIDPMEMMAILLSDSQHFFNEAVFEAFGASANTDMKVLTLNDDAVLAHVKTIYPGATSITGFGGKDDNEVQVDSMIKKLIEIMPLSDNPGTPYDLYQDLNFGSTGTYSVTYPWYYDNSGLQNVRIKDDGTGKPIMNKDEFGQQSVRMINDEALPSEYWQDIPTDTREVIGVEFIDGGTTKYDYFYTEIMIREPEDTICFQLMMKKDFVATDPEEDIKSKFLYARFAINAADPETGDTLQDSLSEDTIKDSFISYSASADDDVFGYLIEELYTTNGVYNNVLIEGGDNGVDLEYIANSTIDDSGYPVSSYMLKYRNGTSYDTLWKDDEGNMSPLFIMPITALRNLTLPDKFQAYNKMFSLFVFTEEEVELKWYQTMLFRFVMLIVSVFVFGATAALLFLANKLLVLIDPRLAAIIGVAMAIYTFNPSNMLSSITSVANNTLSVVQTFHQVAFQSQYESIQKRIEARDLETEEMREETEDYFKNTVVIASSSDRQNFGYNSLYDLPYQQNMMLAQSIQVDTSIYNYS